MRLSLLKWCALLLAAGVLGAALSTTIHIHTTPAFGDRQVAIARPQATPVEDDGVEAAPSPYYSLSEQVMPQAFRDHLAFMVRKINNKWEKSGWRRYEKWDISNCQAQTPECTLFAHFQNGSDRPYRKCCVEHAQLRETTKWVAARLEEHNITYFLSTGSALGSFRHGGTIIPWDTDVDLAIYPADVEKVSELFSGNKAHRFHKDPQGKPMFWIHASASGKPPTGPHVEVFHDPIYTSYPEQLLPLQRCRFYDTELFCPQPAMLDIWFPTGWKVYGGCHYHGKGLSTMYDRGQRRQVSKC